MKLGDIIRNYRLENDLSMGDFAKLSGLSKPYISMLEADKNSRDGKSIVPSISTLQKVSLAVHISINDLLHMLDDEKISVKPEPLNNEQIELLKGYDKLNGVGKSLIRNMIEQLTFGRSAGNGNIVNVGNSNFLINGSNNQMNSTVI